MSLCRGCGASIEWIRTTAGRSMPVDPEPVFIVEEDGGRERFITDDRIKKFFGVRRGLCASLENVPGGGQISPEIERGSQDDNFRGRGNVPRVPELQRGIGDLHTLRRRGAGRRGKRGKMRVAVYVRAHPAVFEERRRGKKESLRRLRERRRRNRPER